MAALIALLGMLIQVPALAQQVNDETNNFDARHKQCLERIADDEELAYEEALIWQSQGGGRRARHCVAMALFALGHADEAAYRLEKLARAPDGGSPQMRVDFYAESADLWLKADLPHKAYFAATSGLKLSRSDADLRILRARAYAAMERWLDAKIDLSSVLAFEPDNAEALRYRADIYRRQGDLKAAMTDIERAIVLDGKNIDTLLVRGEINEALRLAELASKKSNTP
jgi:tetratricopeptide (TPR) repeat protein